MGRNEIRSVLENHPELKKDLFIRGFLITDQFLDTEEYPFFGNWRMEEHGGFSFLAHEKTGIHVFEDRDRIFFLIGHAYDPYEMEVREERILQNLAQYSGSDAYIDQVNNLTGVFVLGIIHHGNIEFLVDPSGMQSACWSKTEHGFYLSSHSQLIGDLCGFNMDPFVEELISYKWYDRVMGPYLPADLTPFLEVKRVIPDILYRYKNSSVKHRRFWPLQSHPEAKDDSAYERVIHEAADLLHRNAELVSRKWKHPWISLTGGIDSNTTFAAANGYYDRFETFSYISDPKEIQDAKAAKQIAEQFGVQHHEFKIPEDSSELQDYDAIRAVLMHNNGYVACTRENEIRKRIYLREYVACDVEVKSWVSETIRGYWYKHYGRRSMPKLSAKLYRNLYKIFLGNRRLAHRLDRLFARYLKEYEYDKIPACYPPADMHFHEVTWGSWGGLNISEMKYCFDITILYNNRRFLDLMFRVPLCKRIADQHHLDMKKVLNRELYDMKIRVVNMHETRFRAWALNQIFRLNRILP